MEKRVCIKKALAGAHKKNMPPLQYPIDKRIPGKNPTPEFFLQQLPGAL